MQKTIGEDEEVPLAAQRHHSQPQIAAAQKKPKGKEVSEDVQKLRDIYRMCIVTDHSRQAEEEARKRAARRPSRIVKQNNATFETELINNTAELAFRKDVLQAMNEEKKMFKKMELLNYIEDMRKSANTQIFDFFKGLDPDTQPKNIKLMYDFDVRVRNLYQEMTGEAVHEYKRDLVMTKVARNERKFIYRG